VTAAWSLGIGSCYIGDILENRERHIELLGLDPYVVPIAMLVFGYPTEQQKRRPKPPRFDRRYVVMKDRYRRQGEEELRAMFADAHKEDDFDEYLRAFCTRKYLSDFALEMTRSARGYLEAFGEKPGR
jgi:hypothetical protein